MSNSDIQHPQSGLSYQYIHSSLFIAADCSELNSKLEYVSPEGLGYFGESNKFRIQAQSDVWSIGCVLLELLTGKPAFRDEDVCSESAAEYRSAILEFQRDWVS